MQNQSTITLRGYQQSAVNAAIESMAAGRKPVLSLPTGSGKSLIAAAIAARLPGRTLVLSHRKELLEQDRMALSRYAPETTSGIYSAGLGRRDTDQQVIFGGVASVYKRMDELQAAGKFETVLVDEAHLVPRGGSGTLYMSCLEQLKDARLCGLSATPYRLDSGTLWEGDGAWFDDCCIHIPPSELVAKGYLAPLVGIGGAYGINADGARIRQGEFVASELSQIACEENAMRNVASEMVQEASGRKSIIVFCIDVNHAEMVLDALCARREAALLVTGKTSPQARVDALTGFKEGDVRWLLNVDVCSTGFDAPRTDCIVSLRPTLSKALWVQQCGRGMRVSPATGKRDCLILDHAYNVARHGSLDMFASYQKTENVEEDRASKRQAEAARKRQYDNVASRAAYGNPMSGTVPLENFQVVGMRYRTALSKRHPGKKNLIAEYKCDNGMSINQWLCVEYGRGAAYHVNQWFRRRGVIIPQRMSANDALRLCKSGRMQQPQSISVYFEEFGGRKWPRIAIEHFDDDIGTQQQEDVA